MCVDFDVYTLLGIRHILSSPLYKTSNSIHEMLWTILSVMELLTLSQTFIEVSSLNLVHGSNTNGSVTYMSCLKELIQMHISNQILWGLSLLNLNPMYFTVF